MRDTCTYSLPFHGIYQKKVYMDSCLTVHRNKDAVIRKLGAVMGHFWVLDKRLAAVEDPDPSYVLTVDNVIKMLAIRMRFR